MKKTPQLRIARATNDLARIAKMYCAGLELEKLGHFEEHQGFNGIMIGSPSCGYHFEFTQEIKAQAPRSHSAEDLLVFYYASIVEWQSVQMRMSAAGFIKVRSHNPYWDSCGSTFEDSEGYRVVLCNYDWNP